MSRQEPTCEAVNAALNAMNEELPPVLRKPRCPKVSRIGQCVEGDEHSMISRFAVVVAEQPQDVVQRFRSTNPELAALGFNNFLWVILFQDAKQGYMLMH